MIEQLDDERESLAEVARRIGDAAQAEGLTRPSPVHVRRLVAHLRRLRADDREVRRAAWDEAVRRLPYAPPNAYEVAEVAGRTRERIDQRERRRRTSLLRATKSFRRAGPVR